MTLPSMEQPTKPRRTLLWLALLVVGLMTAGWLLNTPQGVLGKADAVGYAVCHRISERSFHIGDRALPLCARCSGMYLGAVAGVLFQAWVSPRRGGLPGRRLIGLAAIFVLAFGIDGLNSYLHLFPGAPGVYEPNNTLRLVTGTGMGLVLAAAIYPVFQQTVWRNWDQRRALDGWQQVLGLLALGAGVDVLVLTENAWVLYPLALLSAAGVLMLLGMVYVIIILLLMRMENRVERFQQLSVYIVLAVGVAVSQIALIDLARFWLTGTWAGFSFG